MDPSRSCRWSPLLYHYAHARAAACRVVGSSAISQHRPGRVAALCCDTSSSQAFLLSRYKRLYRDTLASQTSSLSRYKECIVTQPPNGQPLASVMIQNGVSRHNPPAKPRALCRLCRGLYRAPASRIVADHVRPCYAPRPVS